MLVGHRIIHMELTVAVSAGLATMRARKLCCSWSEARSTTARVLSWMVMFFLKSDREGCTCQQSAVQCVKNCVCRGKCESGCTR